MDFYPIIATVYLVALVVIYPTDRASRPFVRETKLARPIAAMFVVLYVAIMYGASATMVSFLRDRQLWP